MEDLDILYNNGYLNGYCHQMMWRLEPNFSIAKMQVILCLIYFLQNIVIYFANCIFWTIIVLDANYCSFNKNVYSYLIHLYIHLICIVRLIHKSIGECIPYFESPKGRYGDRTKLYILKPDFKIYVFFTKLLIDWYASGMTSMHRFL